MEIADGMLARIVDRTAIVAVIGLGYVGLPLIELAGEINRAMTEHVVSRVVSALNDRRKPLNGSRVHVLGAAYKKDVDDPRESPAFKLLERLHRGGAIVAYNDPHVPVLPPMRRYSLRMASTPLTPKTLADQDCVLICTDHTAYDWQWIVRNSPLVIDTRGATRGLIEGRVGISGGGVARDRHAPAGRRRAMIPIAGNRAHLWWVP